MHIWTICVVTLVAQVPEALLPYPKRDRQGVVVQVVVDKEGGSYLKRGCPAPPGHPPPIPIRHSVHAHLHTLLLAYPTYTQLVFHMQ